MNAKEKAALGSIVASAGLTAAKGAIGLLTGSLAILSEAGHSLIDLSATLLTYFAVRVSGKPADAEHQFGHGKVESVSALAETALLFLLSVVVIWEAAQRLIGAQAHAVEATVAAFIIIAGFDRRRFFSRPRLEPCRQGDVERSVGGRCATFFLGHVVVGCCSGRACRRGGGLHLGRCGSGHRGCGLHLHCRLAARPAHHQYAHGHRAGGRERARRGYSAPSAPASSPSSACGRGRPARCCSSSLVSR